MRKIALILSVLMILCVFASCGNNADNETTTEVTESQPENVEIRIKKDLVDEVEFMVSISEVEGISVASDDVYHILTMSQETYINFLKSKAQDVYDAFDELVSAGSFIEDISYTEDFRTISVYVDREGFDAIDKGTQRMQLITVGAYAMSYQMFLADEGQKTTVTAIYSDTKEEAMIISLPITV